jgi:hypothetical protein|tara:strand:- start:2561 stop:3133 length:573 start_codon:yes stop_codon:yes gene_type:complete
MFLAQIANAPQLPDLPPGPSLDRVRGPIEIPPYEPWQIGVMVTLAVLVLGLLIWGIVRFIRTRSSRSQSELPHLTALSELKTAAELTKEDDERFAVLSSLALRRYFETGKGIAALGRTSREFLQALDRQPQINPEARSSLTEFLEHCDRVKFAQASLTEAERNALTESATALIAQFEQAVEATPQEVQPQ